MLKFVQKWIRERREDSEIVEEGTADKWTKCEDGLPSTDRKVEVIVYNPGRRSLMRENPIGMNICFAQFNPHVGWKMDQEGIVISWRDLDKQFRDLVNDLDWAKFSLEHKV